MRFIDLDDGNHDVEIVTSTNVLMQIHFLMQIPDVPEDDGHIGRQHGWQAVLQHRSNQMFRAGESSTGADFCDSN